MIVFLFVVECFLVRAGNRKKFRICFGSFFPGGCLRFVPHPPSGPIMGFHRISVGAEKKFNTFHILFISRFLSVLGVFLENEMV